MRPNNLCKWWEDRQASHWLHADWIEQREGGVWRQCEWGRSGPPSGEVKRCTLTYLPVQERQCLWWEQQGWYAADPLLDREALSWEKQTLQVSSILWIMVLQRCFWRAPVLHISIPTLLGWKLEVKYAGQVPSRNRAGDQCFRSWVSNSATGEQPSCKF